MKNRPMEIKSKIWIEIDGEPVFSRGRSELLKAIDEQGSINKAASVTGISYRRAWGYIKAMEERLGVPLVQTQVGGKHGGGAKLTQAARLLREKYAGFEQGINELVDNRFDEIFGSCKGKDFFSQALCKSDIAVTRK